MRALAAVFVAFLVSAGFAGCAESSSSARGSHGPGAGTCEFDGDFVSGLVRVRARAGPPVDVAIANVRARARIDGERITVDVSDPMVFVGEADGLVVHPVRDLHDDPTIRVDAGVSLAPRFTLAPGRIRARVPSTPVDVAVRCDRLRAGAPARDPDSQPVPRVGATFRLVGEVAVYADPATSGEPIAWFGRPGRTSTIALTVADAADAPTVRVTFAVPGVSFVGFVARGSLEAAPVDAAGPETLPRGTSAPIAPPTEQFDLAPGTRVYATPTSATPWATTVVPMRVASGVRSGSRRLVFEFGSDAPCVGSVCPSPVRARRVVHPTMPSASGDDDASEPAWVDADAAVPVDDARAPAP